MLRPDIRTRGYILVGFPLLCQLTFMIVLVYLLWQTQEEMRERTESRNLVAAMTGLNQEMMELTIAFNVSSTSTDDARKTQKVELFASHVESVTELASKRQHVKGTLAKDIENIQKANDDLRALFQRWRQQQYAPGYAHISDETLYQQTRQSFKMGALALRDIISNEEEIYAGRTTVHDTKSDIRNLFLIAIAVSVTGALVLGYVFARLISDPLSHLSANVHLLSQGKKPGKTLDTKDDFAALDQVLHDVSDSIESATASARGLVNNAEDLICSLRKDGTFITANPYAATMLGLAPDELIGKNLSDIALADEIKVAQKEFETARASSKQRSFEMALHRLDGTPIDTRWSCFWSEIDASLFSVINDITEQKRAERLKHNFVEMIRQDLHDPLASMVHSLSVVSQAASGDTARRVHTMSNNIDRLIVLVNALLESQKFTSSRMQLKLEYLDLQPLVEEAKEMVRSLAEAKKLKIEVSSTSCNVLCDKEKMREVVINLLANAIKFSPPRTAISVSFHEMQKHQIEVRITDQGPGVPLDYRESIFQAFEQTPDARESRQGVGLGLAICKLIVQAHEGSIGVTAITAEELANSRARGVKSTTSDPARPISQQTGSTFWFRLDKVLQPESSAQN